ncbi:two-component system, NtrC family, response regulator HydG [Reichenbachiella faecimaris]|uniref:Two-component system, NtrC family, response regulator HydG n=1 Tax=Reichenbachiella faecimaris TaxID=692418 RepID=A0A1W2G926_REIFA|nr:sigma-54 dependent transcriptional regulator [Reichenbachiella faecimaris]SMD32796.1 two-component system, NtrC family, response regulator HydG [Reichenbachiella faecimaris]
MKRILIVDDEPDICLLLKKYFTKKGYEAYSQPNGEDAIKWLKANEVDLVICDFKLPDYTGLEILQKIKIIRTDIQVIIITGYSDVRIAVDALKKGAYDYVTKPLYPDEILVTVEQALHAKQEQTNTPTRQKPSNKETKKSTVSPTDYISGTSHQAQAVMKHIDLIAATDMSVVIEGETGTGKEYVAKAIHERSHRDQKPFVAVDCGALPKELAASELFGHVKGAFTGAIQDKKGCFERANGGTLFLDEIGNLSYENQLNMLRVLQERVVRKVGGAEEKAVDVRVLVATNENLREKVKSGQFREDIYFRLNEFKIELSALRERPDDIEVFAQHFLSLANQQLNKEVKGFSQDVVQTFRTYSWPGNLRELKNVIKRGVLLCTSDRIGADCLPQEILTPSVHDENMDMIFNDSIPSSLKAVTEQAEKQAILLVLEKTNKNKSKTAELLGVDRKTLYNKMRAYDIEA